MATNSSKKNQVKATSRKSQTLINSPVVKRIQSRPVALQGWLQKRGSDGLMLWKKRWFVLSDYCLFYYKDTLEEKLLGSLILASYKISQCSSDEKGYRKFSFKAEHTNMRTYYFAAENQILMDQWIKAMTLASLLEENISFEAVSEDPAKEYDQQSRKCTDFSSQSQELIKTHEPQPVYANAPPKPKRLNESSSPDDMQFRDDSFQSYQNQSFPVIYNNICPNHQSVEALSKQGFPLYDQNSPDVYGRTGPLQTVRKQTNQSNPCSPTHCASPLNMLKENNSKIVSFSFPPRPHSVDFLEHSGKHNSDLSEKSKLHHRPKSSLSTVNANDDDTWTAEEYARRMRQSSLYVKPTAKRSISSRTDSNFGNRSLYSRNSSRRSESQIPRNELARKSERIPGVLYRAKNVVKNEESKFSRSASARLFRPMSDCQDELFVQSTSESPPVNVQSEKQSTSKEPSNKVHQREEAMKRLLEWKNRMTHSSLRKPQHKTFIREHRGSYHKQSKNDSYQSGSISSSPSRNENASDSMAVKPKTSVTSHEKLFNPAPHQIVNDNTRNFLPSPAGTFNQFSSSDDGLEESESKFGNTLSLIENNIPERDRRKGIVDENSELPTEPLNQLRISDGLNFSNEKLYPNFKQDSVICNNLELPTSSNFRATSIDENQKSKFINNSTIIKDFSNKMNMPHSTKSERDEEWGIKLDESRVIKEFSYHYITTGKYDESLPKNETDSQNNCNFTTKKKSPCQDLENSRKNHLNTKYFKSKNDLHNFSSKEPTKQLDCSEMKKESNVFKKINIKSHKKYNKGIIIAKGSSVRTYRRDVNKPISKDILNEKVFINDSTDRRLVQSDSEALLYDTSSDVEEKVVFSCNHLDKQETSSDDERDEEVAAVLSKENIFTNQVFDSVNSPYKKCFSSDNLDLTLPPNFSSNESKVKINNDQCLTVTISHEKNLSASTEVNSEVPEENYMPMTPRKKSEVVHSRSNSASHNLIIENLLSSTEESPYVEMTQNSSKEQNHSGNRSNLKTNMNGKNESTYGSHCDSERYCEIGKNKDIQYEMIYNTSTSQEPLYMEVPSIKGKDEKSIITLNENETIQDYNKKNTSKEDLSQLKLSSRPTLPDILNTTTPSLNQGSGRSDSSDADDEASKDLDSLDAPRHPRFSLSDTFRPASYYLGASLGDRAIIAMNTEHHDSSDSDLVSPPPIPASSPPLDDLETSIESTVVNKESPLSNIKSDSSNIYSNELFLQSNIKEFLPTYRIKNSLRNSNSNLYEASSEESVNYDKTEQRLKRRPLSADILSSLQEINFVMPSGGTEVKGSIHSDQTKLYSAFDEEQLCSESDHHSDLNPYKHKNKKENHFLFNRDDVSNDNDSEIDLKYKDNRYNLHEPIYESRVVASPIIVERNSGRNQYENLRMSNSDHKFYVEKYNCKDDSDTLKENKCMSAHSNEHQNNAPYYYSDILKIDANNIHEFDKNRWEEHLLSDNEKESIFISTEKGMNNLHNYNQYCDSELFKQDLELAENNTYDTNILSMKTVKDSLDYPKYSVINENLKKKLSSQDQPELLTTHRTRSLEGLIDNQSDSCKTAKDVIFKNNSDMKISSQSQILLSEDVHEKLNSSLKSTYSPNQDIWEEDTLWRESLRKVSIRHTRSLEDLDRKDCPPIMTSPSPIISGEAKTYENVRVTLAYDKNNQNYALDDNLESSNTTLLKSISSYQNEKETEILRTCGSPKNVEFNEKSNKEPADSNNASFEIDREKLRQWDLLSSAPAMLSSNRAVIKPISERKPNFPSNISGADSQAGSQLDENSESQKDTEKPCEVSGLIIPQDQDQIAAWNLKVSAGELLGRTHEELVLLLIQLRRQRATVCQSMEKCHREIETKACLADLDKANRIEHLQKLDELKAKLSDLEKQYEKGKPLVNLVDNMVKLGSLYQAGSPQKIEFIQRIQEQRLLAEERRDWDRIRPDHHELKAKVERLYRLDKLLQEESGTLHSLQQDKGVLERALGGLRHKLLGIHGNSPETEWYKRQQRLLEKELSRVRSILAHNSKKLEETVAENARLEQELVVLRQKLQLSRRSAEPGSANTAALEAELCRVQLLVGDLLRQRQELSLQVRQLTEKSNSLSRQIWPISPDHLAEGVASSKKQLTNGWIETDLDADVSTDVSRLSSPCNRHQSAYSSPLYVNTTDRESVHDCSNYQDELFDGSPLSARSLDCSRISESNTEEDLFKQSYGLQLKEKPQEIKTVRIVKRESERRQRDRDRSGNIGIPITYTNPKRPISDDRFSDKSKSEKEVEEVDTECRSNEPPPTPGPRTDSVNAVWNLVRKNKLKGKLVCRNSFDKSGESLVMQTESPQLSPVYLSETARKIVEEVAWQGMSEKRLVPKEKRRHHTMSGPSLMAPQNLFSQMGSRDDLDIERVLRPRLTTPDVVRSTLIKVDPHYTKETIDNILGAPGKILIPERYIPESQPQLTKEEQTKRSKKADAIRKMLCETTALTPKENDAEGVDNTSSLKRKVAEEKKNREHLLQLSQILAQQVMEKSKIVAGVSTTAVE